MKAALIIGFGALFLFMLVSSLAVNYSINGAIQTQSDVIGHHSVKKVASWEIANASQQRLLIVSRLFHANIASEINALKSSLGEVENRFQQTFKHLRDMSQADKENQLLVQLGLKEVQLEKSIDSIVKLLNQGKYSIALQEFNSITIVLQTDVRNLLNDFSELQELNITNNISETYSQVNRDRYWQFCIFLFFIAIAMMLFIYVVMRLISTENKLLKERNYAVSSFDRISDCVISLNEYKKIDYINSAGECLLNCVSKEVVGRTLGDILRPYNEKNERIFEDILSGENNLADTDFSNKQEFILHDVNGENIFVELDVVKTFSDYQKRLFGYVVVIKDMTKGKQTVMAVERQANTDYLTGLSNRFNFENRLNEFVTIDQDGRFHVVCFMDLDRFSIVNDTCGDSAGNDLLRKVGNLLMHNTRKTDVLARLEGDRFALILVDCEIGEAQTVAHTLIEAMSTFRFSWSGEIFTIGVSIGLVMIDRVIGSNVDMFLNAANVACNRAKERGCNTCCVYNKGDMAKVRHIGDADWSKRILHAIEFDEFVLFGQRIEVTAETADGYDCLIEILIRHIDGSGNLVMPGVFLPAAERSHLMVELDRYVIYKVFSNVQGWLESVHGRIQICINLSDQTVRDIQTRKFVVEKLKEYNIGSDVICFEISEATVINNPTEAMEFITEIKAAGCRFALDRIGNDESTFPFLQSLPVDYLKIDGDLVRQISTDPVQYRLVEAVHKLGKLMGILTVAEFIEDSAILALVKKIGIHYSQGYYLNEPAQIERLFAGLSSELVSVPGNVVIKQSA